MQKHMTADGRWAIIGQDYYDPDFQIIELPTGYSTRGYYGRRTVEGAPCLGDYNKNQTFSEKKWLTQAGTAMFECYSHEMDREWVFIKSVLGDLDLRYWDAQWMDDIVRKAYNNAHEIIMSQLLSSCIKNDKWLSRGAKTWTISPIWKEFGRWYGNQDTLPATGFMISIEKPEIDIYVGPEPFLKTMTKEFQLMFTRKNVLVEDKETELSYPHIMTLQDFLNTL